MPTKDEGPKDEALKGKDAPESATEAQSGAEAKQHAKLVEKAAEAVGAPGVQPGDLTKKSVAGPSKTTSPTSPGAAAAGSGTSRPRVTASDAAKVAQEVMNMEGKGAESLQEKIEAAHTAGTPVQSLTYSRQRLTAEVLATMSKPEIRAVANDRGYKVGLGSRRILAERFLTAQEEDTSLPKR